MKVTQMTSSPSSRAEFERNANIHDVLLREGRISFAPQVRRSVTSLRRVRKLPNGRIDLLSIDEMARVSLNMAAEMVSQAGFGDEVD